MLFSDYEMVIPHLLISRLILWLGVAFAVTISPLIGFYLITSVMFYFLSYLIFFIRIECEAISKYVEEYKSENGIE